MGKKPPRGPEPLTKAPPRPLKGQLLPFIESWKTHINEVLSTLDANSDGNVARTELRDVLMALGPDGAVSYTPEDVDALFNAADLDRNGRISIEEFTNWLFSEGAERLMPAATLVPKVHDRGDVIPVYTSSGERRETGAGEGKEIIVSVSDMSGLRILDAFSLNGEDYLRVLREAVDHAIGCEPGYLCTLLLGEVTLEDDVKVNCSCMVNGSEVIAFPRIDEAVETMLEKFRKLVQLVRENHQDFLDKTAGFFEEFGEDDPLTVISDALMGIDCLGFFGQRPGRKKPSSPGRRILGPALPFFVELLTDELELIRSLAAWAIGGAGREALPVLPQLVALVDDASEHVQRETATSLSYIAHDAPEEALPVVAPLISHSSEIVSYNLLSNLCKSSDDRWHEFPVFIEGGREAALPELIKLVANPREQQKYRPLNRCAMRLLPKIDMNAFRRICFHTLQSREAWHENNSALTNRLNERNAFQSNDANAVEEKIAELCRGSGRETDTELATALTRFTKDAEIRRRLWSLDGNELPVPVRSDFDPLLLREAMHADPKAYDPTVAGEAAWTCLPQGIVASCETNDVVAESRRTRPASEARRRRHFLAEGGTHLPTYGAFAAHFFDKLSKIEGGDPFHQWMFPVKDSSPRADYEPFHKKKDERPTSNRSFIEEEDSPDYEMEVYGYDYEMKVYGYGRDWPYFLHSEEE